MSPTEKVYSLLHARLLSEEVKHKSEQVIVSIAIVSFIIHLLLILLADLNLFALNHYPKLLGNPIAAIYTPFSFILIYEVYLLVFYLPKSMTIYVGKQYEIITLIVIRRIFKDLANLELTSDWFSDKYDLQFTYDIIATIFLFLLIYLFNRFNQRQEAETENDSPLSAGIALFIKRKNIIAMGLVPLFLLLAIYSLGHWIYETLFSDDVTVDSIINVNEIFFNEFFTILILTDVLLLLLSLFHTDKFSKVIRNSGFIISTILIRISFGVEGLLNTLLIVAAVLFGVIMLVLHNWHEQVGVSSPGGFIMILGTKQDSQEFTHCVQSIINNMSTHQLSRIGLNQEQSKVLADKLNLLLANYQIFYMNTRGFHWNIKGEKFFELHLKFEELYNDSLIKIDEIAERILTLGLTPSHTYSDFLEIATVREAKNVSDGDEAVRQILDGYGTLLPIERDLLNLSAETNDEGTNALMSDYIREQEKQVWMYSAFLNQR